MTQDDPEEIKLWIEQRRKNFPTAQRITQKEQSDQIKKDIGLIPGQANTEQSEDEPVNKLSKIEIKLRRKLKLIKGLDKGEQKKKKKKKGR